MYILAHKFGEQTYYARINDETSWDEIYSAEAATQFSTKTEAVNWSKENTTFGEYAVALPAKQEIEKFKRNLAEGMVRRSFEVVNKKISRAYNGESPKQILRWWISLQGQDDKIRYEDYKTWPKLYSVFKHIWDKQGFHSSDYKEIYHTFEVRVPKNSNLKDFKKELDLIVPHITYLDKKGNKIIGVIDHHLGKNGNIVNFIVKPNDVYALVSRWEDKIEGTLEEVFNYWKTHRYYGD